MAAFDDGAGFQRAVVVTAFEGSEVFAAITHSRSPTTDEAGWTGTGSDVPSVPELSGLPIRMWWAAFSGATSFIRFEDACRQASIAYGSWADAAEPMLAAPEPEVCGEHLELHFVSQHNNYREMDPDGRTMHGLWVAAALDDTLLVDNGRQLLKVVGGRDFVEGGIEGGSDPWASEDNYAPAVYDYDELTGNDVLRETFVDPDPVHFSPGPGRPRKLTRVYVAKSHLGDAGESVWVVSAYQASLQEVCKGWPVTGQTDRRRAVDERYFARQSPARVPRARRSRQGRG